MFESLTKVLRGAASIFVSGLDKDAKTKPTPKPTPQPPAPPQS